MRLTDRVAAAGAGLAQPGAPDTYLVGRFSIVMR